MPSCIRVVGGSLLAARRLLGFFLPTSHGGVSPVILGVSILLPVISHLDITRHLGGTRLLLNRRLRSNSPLLPRNSRSSRSSRYKALLGPTIRSRGIGSSPRGRGRLVSRRRRSNPASVRRRRRRSSRCRRCSLSHRGGRRIGGRRRRRERRSGGSVRGRGCYLLLVAGDDPVGGREGEGKGGRGGGFYPVVI